MLQVEEIDVFYGDMQALNGLALDVREGEIVALVGANGAGKSTTLRTISGLLHPRNGRIVFCGGEIHKNDPHTIVDLGISHVPEGRQLFPMMSVRENLLLGGHVKRARGQREEKLIKEIFPMFPRLKEREHQMAGTLSGGEQQMVAIARGMMSNPRLLILDEPSLGLAPVIVKEMFEIIKTIRSKGMTVMIVEQNVVQTLKIADRAYVVENGHVVMSGDSKELLNDDHVKQAYLGM
ncbi:ABC transporter ATP-binding protein [Fodinisporobacter ferrooxydans]|uniref:ABC transporter ATP-binding protein n=1 Tax=Fodinisporobacter ferrooxydans TaxID=2901836 RepID=A0ABY4CRC7_9BACL|nr:ABC transporter ATP-binding protein [Alicyclobacillaceae bacterium MYW30-H2]